MRDLSKEFSCGKCDVCVCTRGRIQCPHHLCHECWETVLEYFESNCEGEWTKETSTCAPCKAAIEAERIERMGREHDAQMRGYVKPSERPFVEPYDAAAVQDAANQRAINMHNPLAGGGR